MVKCPMCGKRFNPDDVEEYIGEKFDFFVLDQLWKDNGQICDSCCLSVYYADHPDDEIEDDPGTAAWDEYTHIKEWDD